MSKKKEILVSILSLLGLLLVLVFVGLCVLSNFFQKPVQTVFAKADDKVYWKDTSNVYLAGKEIAVTNLLFWQDYSWAIVPNSAELSFTVDGERRTLTDVDDYSDVFDVAVNENRLTIKSVKLIDVIKKAFGSDNVVLDTSNTDGNKSYFTFKLSNGQCELNLGLLLSSAEIQLNPEQIVF